MAWVLTVSNWICQLEIYQFYRESCFSVSDEMSGSIFNVWLLTAFSTHFSPFSTRPISRKSISEQSDRKISLLHFWYIFVAANSCLIRCNPLDCSTAGFSVLHYLLEFAETHLHWASDAIQPSHPLLPSFPALSLSQHQCLFQWVCFSHQVARFLQTPSIPNPCRNPNSSNQGNISTKNPKPLDCSFT